MTTIDNIMALADEYTCLCTFMQDGTAAESAKRARQALRAALTKALEAQQAEQGWQPIETAPRETEVFIGRFIDGEFKFGRSEMFYEQANEFAGETFSGWVWSEDECSSSITESPTHWMSLPQPPTVYY